MALTSDSSTIESIYSGKASIIKQTDEVVNSNQEPLKETTDAADLISDSSNVANKTFAQSTKAVDYDAAYRMAYDHSQAVSRIMQLYNYTRTDFYDIATSSSEVRQNQLNYQLGVCKKLESRGSEAAKAYNCGVFDGLG